MVSVLSGSGSALLVVWKSSDHFLSLCVETASCCSASVVMKLLRDFSRCCDNSWT